jgi:anti-sigma factor RsiW
MSMSDLSCQDVVNFLYDYLAGELDPAVRADFDAHIARCDECVAFIRSYEQTIGLSKRAFETLDDAPADRVPEALLAAILGARQRG